MLIEHVQDNTISIFRDKFAAAKALIIDNVSFFSNKTYSQSQLFLLLERLDQEGVIIILAGSVHPMSEVGFERKLQSRFCKGTAIKIGNPELAVRTKFLTTYAERHNFSMDYETANVICTDIAMNFFEMKGVIHQLSASRVNSEDRNLARGDIESLLYD